MRTKEDAEDMGKVVGGDHSTIRMLKRGGERGGERGVMEEKGEKSAEEREKLLFVKHTNT